MKKRDEILDFIEYTITSDKLLEEIKAGANPGLNASQIQKQLGIIRNNASTILNQLWKESHLVKVNTRPVTFLPFTSFQKAAAAYNVEPKFCYQATELQALFSTPTDDLKDQDPFKELLGYNSSLTNQVSQAKAAIVYPPKGLHTLILGESGVGKTTFAAAMHKYGMLINQKTEADFPFVTFNCADYFTNPQLLLSQLFGHAKNAFTGADHEKQGLVEKANGGILFLDEIHRLPPDGQEMLFYLMDKGEFCRLGETGTSRKSNPLIIAATTENPSASLLTTFIRRIPVNITLPPFAKKPVSEKVEIIENFFYCEAVNLQKQIQIAPEVLKALAIHNFSAGNIGQLRSEIKLLCAKAFLHHLQLQTAPISIEYAMLHREFRENLFCYSKIDKSITNYLDMFSETIFISPNKEGTISSLEIKNDIYELITTKLNQLQQQGIDSENINQHLKCEIDEYFSKINNHFNNNRTNITNLYKIVPKEIVEITSSLIAEAQTQLGIRFNSHFIFGLSLHIQALLKRIDKGDLVQNRHLSKIKREHPQEFDVAKKMVQTMSQKFGVIVPEDEKGFLVLLLIHNRAERHFDRIGVIILCHGDSTASSIANVCNSLLDTEWMKAIDMPLSQSIDEAYNKLRTVALTMQTGKGILLLTDMGSLLQFGKRLTDDTGIKTQTLSFISTPLALEVLRNVLYKMDDLDALYESIRQTEGNPCLRLLKKPLAILSVCVTGYGSSVIVKTLLDNLIASRYQDTVEIVVSNYLDATQKFHELKDKYRIVAAVGNINPDLPIPYFDLNQLMLPDFKKKFFHLLDTQLEFHDNEPIPAEKTIYEIAQEMLEQYVKFLNPKIAVANIRRFIEKINYQPEKKDFSLDLLIHMGCMLDRCISKISIQYENIESFRLEQASEFTRLSNALSFLEKEYQIKISDDEIAYIIKIILTRK